MSLFPLRLTFWHPPILCAGRIKQAAQVVPQPVRGDRAPAVRYPPFFALVLQQKGQKLARRKPIDPCLFERVLDAGDQPLSPSWISLAADSCLDSVADQARPIAASHFGYREDWLPVIPDTPRLVFQHLGDRRLGEFFDRSSPRRELFLKALQCG